MALGSRCALAALLLALPTSAAPLRRSSVTCSAGGRDCTQGAWSEQVWSARATFRASQNETGWATLFVETAPGIDDDVAAYAAGWVEAILTADLIEQTFSNVFATDRPSEKVLDFVRAQLRYMQMQSAKSQSTASPDDKEGQYWKSVGLVLQQLNGMADGYATAAREEKRAALSMEDIMLIGMSMELGDIQNAVSPSLRPNYTAMGDEEFFRSAQRATHCSALFRVTPDLSDLLAGHTTWTGYSWMLRIYKAYTLRLSTSSAETQVFSSYPGALVSIDDFLTTSQQLVVIETTNDVFNTSLYDLITPETVPYWVRVTVATRNAANAKDWHDIFYRRNSGTYNNQWMVADYKKFTPYEPLPPWTLAVSEQIPGPFFHPAEDMTMVLQRGHWPSFNVPYFQDVYDISGYPEMVKQRGPLASYQLAPRAPIFRRDAELVNSLEAMQNFMRENNYGSGDLLAKTPCHAIACRNDLLSKTATADGAIDAKVVSKELMDAFAVKAISGPATQRQPPFSFAGQWTEVPHAGMPIRFDFDWQTFSLEAFGGPGEDHDENTLKIVV